MTSVTETTDGAWRNATPVTSTSTPVRALTVPQNAGWFRKLLAFAGPGYMVSVGYMDPGNWATDIAGGASFGYSLLFVVLLSNLLAVGLQSLAVRLGVVTGRDLAEACRDHYPRPVALALYFAAEFAIVACDLAEVVGTAVALKLLFGIPTALGAVLSAFDAALPLFLMNRGVRRLEAFVISVTGLIFACFVFQIIAAQPSVVGILGGLFAPQPSLLSNGDALYLAAGIVGATVMPHNLYLHSFLVRTRRHERTPSGIRDAIRWATVDGSLALTLALLVNAAILIVAAVAFHDTGRSDVADIESAHELLSPILGVGAASTVFGVALLASGVNSTVTATLAGQVVMEGFLRMRLAPWVRRLLTRSLAIVPAVLATVVWGDAGTGKLLVFSQVALSAQLPFAVIPLVLLVSDRRKMGAFAISRKAIVAAWSAAGLIVLLNLALILNTLFGG